MYGIKVYALDTRVFETEVTVPLFRAGEDWHVMRNCQGGIIGIGMPIVATLTWS